MKTCKDLNIKLCKYCVNKRNVYYDQCLISIWFSWYEKNSNKMITKFYYTRKGALLFHAKKALKLYDKNLFEKINSLLILI
jgi:predicted HTH transcriptional regulator